MKNQNLENLVEHLVDHIDFNRMVEKGKQRVK